jgi:predicted dehydrogenase
MSLHKLRVGIAGCGRMGAATRAEQLQQMGKNWIPLSHADGVKAVPEFSLAALCDADESVVKAAAVRYGVREVHTDWRNMLRDTKLDVLCVATRSDIRPDILADAADAGIRAVHCEKPLALSVGEGLRAAQAIERKKIAFSYGTLRTYMQVFRDSRDIAASGALGRLQSITVKFGRGGLMWNHPHSVSALCMFSGTREVDFVQANLAYDRTQASGKLIDTDPLLLSATVGFSNGVTGHIVDQDGLTVEIAGADGALSIVGDGAWTIRLDYSAWLNCDPRKWEFSKDETEASGRLCALRELRDAIRAQHKPSLSIMDAFAEHRILFAMAQSDLEGGRRIRLDEVDPALVVTGRTHGKVA